MPLILNIETSTDICSVCLSLDGKIIAIRETERSYSHSEVIALFIDECFNEANINIQDLDAVSISRGPGSYTALRIGASTAKGICFSLSIPLIAIDTLEALRESVIREAKENDLVIPMIDARRKEVYRSIYNHEGETVEEVSPLILDESSFSEYSHHPNILFCGDGVSKAKEILTIENSRFYDIECSSKFMVALSEEKIQSKKFENLAYYEPFYYKGPNITVQKKNILR